MMYCGPLTKQLGRQRKVSKEQCDGSKADSIECEDEEESNVNEL